MRWVTACWIGLCVGLAGELVSGDNIFGKDAFNKIFNDKSHTEFLHKLKAASAGTKHKLDDFSRQIFKPRPKVESGIQKLDNISRQIFKPLPQVQNGIQKLDNISRQIFKPLPKVEFNDISKHIFKPIPEVVSDIQKFGKKLSKIVDTVNKESKQAFNESIGHIKHITEAIVNITFNDDEISDFQTHFMKQMAIKGHKQVDKDKLRNMLVQMFDDAPAENRSFDKTFCGLCKILIRKIQLFTTTVAKVAQFICDIYILFSTFTLSNFCYRVIEMNLPVFNYIIDNSKIMDPEYTCTILLQNENCYYYKSALIWTTTMPSTPPILPALDFNALNETIAPLKILHLTDLHITPDYAKNSVAECGYPLCCKRGLGSSIKGKKAGYWGDYNCDIPPWLLDTTLIHINHTHPDLDFIYFTGDIVDHTIWNTSIQTNENLLRSTYKAIQETFPKLPVFPVIGNHESSPLNVFAPTNEDIDANGLSTSWLYQLAAEAWTDWLPSSALETVKRQGYYAYSLNSKLKIIALNNNVCYNFNWWLLLDTTFLDEHLQFLITELTESENNGQYVHILAHVPMGNRECIQPWEVSYNNIVKRFAHIIKGQFTGHTHTDELKIFYDENKPINVAYNGASLTPYVKYNPNYKIIDLNPITMEIMDIHTYIFNLTEANMNDNTSPAWYKLYSMKKDYGLQDLSPESFGALIDEMFTDSNVANQYWRYYVRDGDASLQMGCDSKCQFDLLCSVVTTQSFYPRKVQCRQP